MKKIKGLIERYAPLLAGLVTIVVVFIFDIGANKIPNSKDLLTIGVNLAAISIGFLIAFISVLVSLKNNQALMYLQKLYYKHDETYLSVLVDYVKSALKISFIYAFFSGSLLMINQQEVFDVFDFFFKVWNSVSTIFFTSLARIVLIMSHLLDDVFS